MYDICREALKVKRPLIDLLAEPPEINKHVSREQLAIFCDPMNNLGQEIGRASCRERVLASV